MRLLSRLNRWLTRHPGILGINERNLDLVYRDHRPGRFAALDDKVQTKILLERAGVAAPATIAILRREADLDRLDAVVAGRDEVVLKPARGSGGRGILVLRRATEGGWRLPSGRRLTPEQLRIHAGEVLQGLYSLEEEEPDAVLLEERIHAHPFLREIVGQGLPDLRILVHRGEILQAMWRLPTKASDGKANLHQGGVGVGIDLATGRTTHASWRGRSVTAHPDTEAPLLGLRVPHWEECRAQALKAAAVVDVEYLGVDLTLDARRGPVVLELNARPGLEIQVANRRGLPVAGTRRRSRLEIVSQRVAWVLLALLALGPLASGYLQTRWRQEPPRRLLATAVETSEQGPAPEGLEWDNDESPVSQRSDAFARARAAVAEGDTAAAMELYAVAAQDSSIAPFAWNNLALLWKNRGEYGRATVLLERALQALPTYARGFYNLGLVLEETGREDEALAAFDHALALRSSHARSWAHRAEILRRRGDLEEALRSYDQAVRYQPGSRSHRFGYGLALREAGRYAEAAEALGDALRLDRRGDETTLYWWGRSLLDSHGSQARVDSLRRLLDEHVEDGEPRMLELSGRLELRRGDPEVALARFEALRRRGYRPSFSGKAAAWSALEAGRWQDVDRLLDELEGEDDLDFLARLNEWGRSLEDDPVPLGERLAEAPTDESLEARLVDDTAVPSVLLRWAEYRRAVAAGDEEKADAVLGRLASEHPHFRPALRVRFAAAAAAGRRELAEALGASLPNEEAVRLDLARLALDDGDARAAAGHLEALPAATRERPDVLVLRARVAAARGQQEKALSLVRRAVKLSPQDATLQAALGEAFLAAGRRPEAAEAYRRAIDLEPTQVEARESLARIQQARRRYEEAAATWRRVIQLDGADGSRLFNLALCLQRLDRLEEAVQTYERCLDLAPENWRAVFNRALALEDLGRPEQAAEGFRRVLALNPGHLASIQHLEQILPESRP